MIGTAMPKFRTNLKPLMLKKSVQINKRLTQKEVAVATGLSVPTIGRWYKGSVERIEMETIVKLMDYFGCTFEELVTFEE